MAVSRDERVDTYIEQAAPFAQPILSHLRNLVHQACPDVVETIKWGAPAYDYKGILAVIAAMKSHVIFNLWKGELIPEVRMMYANRFSESLGTFGRIKALQDLPPDQKIIAWIEQAMDLNERGVKLPQRSRQEPKPEIETPDDLVSALESN